MIKKTPFSSKDIEVAIYFYFNPPFIWDQEPVEDPHLYDKAYYVYSKEGDHLGDFLVKGNELFLIKY